jgi:hypothetical protein
MVALIASPVDLGAIPSLFGKPQEYAEFLDRELSYSNNPQPLLVVMRNGYGVQGLDPAATAVAASLGKPPGASSDDLAQAAILALPKLAEAAGHPIGGVSSGSAPGSFSRVLPAVLFAVVAVGVAAAMLAVRGQRARARRLESVVRRRGRARSPRRAGR